MRARLASLVEAGDRGSSLSTPTVRRHSPSTGLSSIMTALDGGALTLPPAYRRAGIEGGGDIGRVKSTLSRNPSRSRGESSGMEFIGLLESFNPINPTNSMNSITIEGDDFFHNVFNLVFC